MHACAPARLGHATVRGLGRATRRRDRTTNDPSRTRGPQLRLRARRALGDERCDLAHWAGPRRPARRPERSGQSELPDRTDGVWPRSLARLTVPVDRRCQLRRSLRRALARTGLRAGVAKPLRRSAERGTHQRGERIRPVGRRVCAARYAALIPGSARRFAFDSSRTDIRATAGSPTFPFARETANDFDFSAGVLADPRERRRRRHCACPVGRGTEPDAPERDAGQVHAGRLRLRIHRRDVMIPMRDGVKLHTVILVPEGRARAPILLTRTPYDANATTTYAQSAHLAPDLNGYDNALDVIIPGGYIRVVQDIRGKYGSEGDYVMNRPLRGPLNPTTVDESTDTYDTIDWLVKNIPETNGNVGELGISYDGFEPLMGLVNPHPALKVADADESDGRRLDGRRLVPQRRVPPAEHAVHPRAGSDARQFRQVVDRSLRRLRSCTSARGSAGELGRAHGLEQVGFWNKILEHPSYDSWWQQQAMDKILARAAAQGAGDARAQPLGPGGHLRRDGGVQGDQTQGHRTTTRSSSRIGPWHHGRRSRTAARSARSSSTATRRTNSRREILGPFLAHYLKDGAPQGRRGAGECVRDGHEPLGAAHRVAVGLRERLPDRSHPALSRTPVLTPGSPRRRRRRRVRRLRLRSRQAGAVPRAADPADRLRQRTDLARMARRRSARGVGPNRRAGVSSRTCSRRR